MAVILAVGTAVVVRYPLNYDAAWLLFVADRWLSGATLYRDVVEINPPLIIWISALPVAFSRALGVSTTHSLLVFVLLLTAASLLLTCLLLRVTKLFDRPEPRRILLLTLAVVMLPLAGFVFAEREHLLLALILPYLLVIAARVEGRIVPPWSAGIAGISAAIGIALKPYFVPAWLALEGWIVTREGVSGLHKRPEGVVIPTFLGLYAAAILALFPQYLDMRHLMVAYDIYDQPLSARLARPELILCALVLVLHVGAPPKRDYRGLRKILLLSCTAFAVAAIWQGKGWGYHYYPAGALALCGLAVAVGEVSFGPGRPRRAAAVVLMLTTLFVGTAGRAVLAARLSTEAAYRTYRSELNLVREQASGRPVFILSHEISLGFPLTLDAEADWSSRFHSLWMAPAVHSEEYARRLSPAERKQLAGIREYLFDSLAEDLRARPPVLLMVDHDPRRGGLGLDIDYLEFLSQDPRLAELLKPYRWIGRSGYLEIYRRAPLADSAVSHEQSGVAPTPAPHS